MRTLQTLKGCASEGIITGLRGELNQVGRASSKDHAWVTCIFNKRESLEAISRCSGLTSLPHRRKVKLEKRPVSPLIYNGKR